MVIVPGGAGCGKTTAIATNASKMFADYDHEYFCLAPEMEQAENLANAVGEDIRHTDKATFFKNIFKIDLQHYRKNEATEHFELAEIPVINDNLFDKSKKLKILFIDEVSLFTEAELKLISNYAVKNGIHVVGLGDPVQNSAKVYTDESLTEAGETKHSGEKE
jgi:dephospho-CoA kinase